MPDCYSTKTLGSLSPRASASIQKLSFVVTMVFYTGPPLFPFLIFSPFMIHCLMNLGETKPEGQGEREKDGDNLDSENQI